ncbi:MAG: hypothetical protein FWC80_03885 [Firmicutes bacterium]|nr:hypothetical protein [Bacillota bacterium]
MYRTALIGMAVGTVVGAVVVNSFRPANDMVNKAKSKVKGKLDDLMSQNEVTMLD